MLGAQWGIHASAGMSLHAGHAQLRLMLACCVSDMLQDLSVVGYRGDGSAIMFQHPAFQSAMMFLGEVIVQIVPVLVLAYDMYMGERSP